MVGGTGLPEQPILILLHLEEMKPILWMTVLAVAYIHLHSDLHVPREKLLRIKALELSLLANIPSQALYLGLIIQASPWMPRALRAASASLV